MKTKYCGYDIECTPEEFLSLLKIQDIQTIKYTYPYTYPAPFTITPSLGGSGHWNELPAKVICDYAGDMKVNNHSISISCNIEKLDKEQIAKSLVEALKNKGIKIEK